MKRWIEESLEWQPLSAEDQAKLIEQMRAAATKFDARNPSENTAVYLVPMPVNDHKEPPK